MKHTSVSPNKLRHYGINIQDNLIPNKLLHTIAENKKFNMELKMNVIIMFANTCKALENELQSCPCMDISSYYGWNRHNVQFHSQAC